MNGFTNERDEWLLQFVENLPALAWAKDSEGRYVFVNAAAALAFRRRESGIIGKTDHDIFPHEIAENFRGNDKLALEQGQRLQTIEVLPDRNGVLRHSLVTKFPLENERGEKYVAGTAIDITDQRAAYANQEFLFAISEKVRIADDPDVLLSETARALGEFLSVDRCLFNEIDVAGDQEIVRSDFSSSSGRSVAGEHRISIYSPETTALMKEGRTVVNNDSRADERTAAYFDEVYRPAGELAYVAVPMMKGGEWKASLWCSSRQPRAWTDLEVQLIEAVAERTWSSVERLQAEKTLMGSNRTFLDLIQGAPFGVYLVDSEFRLAQVSRGGEAVFAGIHPLIGRDLAEILRIVWKEPFASEAIGLFRKTLETGEPYRAPNTTEHRGNIPGLESYDWQISRLTMPDGSLGVVCYFYETTERVNSELDSRFLSEIGERCRSANHADDLVSDIVAKVGRYLEADRCYFLEIDEDSDLCTIRDYYASRGESISGKSKLSDYDLEARRYLAEGGTEVVKDSETRPRSRNLIEARDGLVRAGAKVVVPLLRDASWKACLGVSCAERREWQPREVRLMETVAEWVWNTLEKLRSEVALRESERRFRNMADNAPILIWVTDETGSCSYLSRSWYDFTGQAPETELGTAIGSAIHPVDRTKYLQKFLDAVSDETGFYSEYRLRRADGTYCWMICKAQPRLSEGGKFVGHIGSMLEITDRKQAEEQLRASRDLSQSVVDSIRSHIAVLDPQGVISMVNKAWKDFGRDNSDGLPTESLGPGANYLSVCDRARGDDTPDEDAIYEGVKAVLDRKIDSYSLEYPCHSPTADRWFFLTVYPLLGGGAVVAHENITERRIAEQKIRDTAERLSLAQKAGKVGIWDWNGHTNATYWSDETWAIYGLKGGAKEPQRSLLPGHLHDIDRDRALNRIQEVVTSAATEYEDEFRIVRPDGEVRWIASSATVERADDGVATRMYGVNIDITDRKSIEQKIRTSEEQVRLITDSIPALVSYVDREHRYRFANRRYTQWFGLASDEIVGRTVTEILGEAAAEQLRPQVDRALAGEQVDFETWIDYPGAGRRFVRVSYMPDLRQEGEVAGYYALVSDLTDQRRSEELLRSSENRMKVLTESFTDYAIISTDSAGMVESWNPGAENIFGFAEGEIVGTSAHRLFTPEDIAAGVPEDEMRRAGKLGRASDERWHLRKDGSRFFASGVMAPLYSEGELTGFAKIATDLTEKRKQSEELQRAYEEMENRVLDRTQELAEVNRSLVEQINERLSAEGQKIRLLQRLITTQEVERKRIALDIHDHLGQRLTALRLKIASLIELCSNDDRLRSRAIRLQQIAELLDSEVSFLTWQLRPVALDELGLTAALETFVHEWSRHYNKQAEFQTTGLRELALPFEIETQIYRITQEALNNVIKHAEAESVSVILERLGDHLVLIVEDDGSGFDLESLERRPNDKHGVGLPGMKERAELIGGEIDIESSFGAGTTLYLRIPLETNSRRA